MTKSAWKDFFDNHAPDYMQNAFTANTAFEVEFIIRELGLRPGNRILDVGCGTGRHSVPLAARGMNVTGLDLSTGMLDIARKYALHEDVSIEWVQADAAGFHFREPFDHAICLCEGAMGLLETGEDAAERDLSILKNISDCLLPGGKLLMTVLNGLKKIREHSAEDIRNGKFDPFYLVSQESIPQAISGQQENLTIREKGFTAGELYHMMQRAGMEILHLWGGTAGSWNKQQLDPDEYEIMIAARKSMP